jgi:hypothetical protein
VSTINELTPKKLEKGVTFAMRDFGGVSEDDGELLLVFLLVRLVVHHFDNYNLASFNSN